MSELISVIIPIYNAAQTLDKCMASVIKQTYDDFEIILIDDGSIDGSGNLCDLWCGKDLRVRVVHQHNKGVSAARNLGIEISRGEYLAFVDPDDFVEPSYLEHLYNALIKGNAECSICSFVKEPREKFAKAIMSVCEEDETVCALEVMRHEASGRWQFIPVWNKLYKRSLWNNVCFPEGRYEDEAVFHRVLMQCNRVALLSSPLYHYRINPKGFMNSVESSVRSLERLKYLEQRLHDYALLGDEAIVSGTFSQFHFHLVGTAMQLGLSDEIVCQNIRDFVNRISSYKEKVTGKTLRHRIELTALCACPITYLRIRLFVVRLKNLSR